MIAHPFLPPTMGPIPDIAWDICVHADFCGDYCSASGTAGAAQWLVTNVGTGAGTVTFPADELGGVIAVESGSTADDTKIVMLQGANFQTAAANREIVFYARFKVEDADEDNLFIGLADLAALTSQNVLALTFTSSGSFEGVGFYADHAAAGTATLKYAVGTGAAVSAGSTGLTMADGTYYEVAFKITNRQKVEFWVKISGVWTRVSTVDNTGSTTYLSTDVLELFIQEKTRDTGADWLKVDRLLVAQQGR